MSAFDDEFGLFSEETGEEERRATLSGRRVSGQRPVGDIDREEQQPDRPAAPSTPRGRTRRDAPARPSTPRERTPRTGDPYAGQRRAQGILDFLARKLVSKPDAVEVDLFLDETGQPTIEVVVDREDLGKVVGRSGRVAHALRTIARASAEDRITVDILDREEAEGEPEA
ncbi:MAG: KH domain-containing protein [Candidatus Baltobacteraceae bacterium]